MPSHYDEIEDDNTVYLLQAATAEWIITAHQVIDACGKTIGDNVVAQWLDTEHNTIYKLKTVDIPKEERTIIDGWFEFTFMYPASGSNNKTIHAFIVSSLDWSFNKKINPENSVFQPRAYETELITDEYQIEMYREAVKKASKYINGKD